MSRLPAYLLEVLNFLVDKEIEILIAGDCTIGSNLRIDARKRLASGEVYGSTMFVNLLKGESEYVADMLAMQMYRAAHDVTDAIKKGGHSVNQKDEHGNIYLKADEVDFAYGLSMGDVGRILMTLETLYKTMHGDVKDAVTGLHAKLSNAQERCANEYMIKHHPEASAAILCKAERIDVGDD